MPSRETQIKGQGHLTVFKGLGAKAPHTKRKGSEKEKKQRRRKGTKRGEKERGGRARKEEKG